MTVEFSCPECGKVYMLASKLAGKMARCKQCQTVMIVPGMVEAVVIPPPPIVEPPPPSPGKKPSKRPSRPQPARNEPEDPFGVEDVAPLPPRKEEGFPAATGSRKGSKRRRSSWEDVPQLEFGHAVLAWFLILFSLIGLGFWIDDGAYKCAQLMVWLGISLVPVAVVWFWVTAFQEGLNQGLLLLFMPFYSIYHLFRCWETTHRPFWTGVGAAVSMVLGALYYSFFGDDVGERALLAFPGSVASRRVVIDESVLPLRPPEIPEGMTTEDAVARWEKFLEAVKEGTLNKLVEKKRRTMARNHGKGSISVVRISLIMDAATFDSVANALRKFAGPGPDDFFAYPTASRGKTAGMVVLISPANDPRGLLGGIEFGTNKMVNQFDGSISVMSSTDSVPPQLAELLKFEEDENARLAKISGKREREMAEIGAAIPKKEPRKLTSLPMDGDLELSYPPCAASTEHTIFPSPNSRFVAIGDNSLNGYSRESWDLEQRRRVGVIPDMISNAHGFVLSPDGTALAGISYSSLKTVDVWSFETGQLIRRIELDAHYALITWIDFVGPNQLLINTPSNKNSYHLYDIATGQRIRSILSPVTIDPDSMALDPSARGLALASFYQKSAGVYSLLTTKLTSDWPVPPAKQNHSMICKGMTYSTDGLEIAAIFEDSGFARFMSWEAGGKLLSNALVPARTPDSVTKPTLYRGRALEWLPDRSGWMVYGHGIVDRQTGRRVWSLPGSNNFESMYPKRINASGDLFFVGGANRGPVLKSVKLPLDQIAEAIRAARGTN